MRLGRDAYHIGSLCYRREGSHASRLHAFWKSSCGTGTHNYIAVSMAQRPLLGNEFHSYCNQHLLYIVTGTELRNIIPPIGVMPACVPSSVPGLKANYLCIYLQPWRPLATLLVRFVSISSQRLDTRRVANPYAEVIKLICCWKLGRVRGAHKLIILSTWPSSKR